MGAAASVVPLPKDLDNTRTKAVLGGKTTLEAVCAKIRDGSIRRVIVLCGAGISVNAGIPDFRTKGTGLYDNLESYGLPTPESVFDLEFFKENPKPFCTLAKTLFPDVYTPQSKNVDKAKAGRLTLKYKPTRTHHFLNLLAKKGILRRVFTQNIDGLEYVAGIPPARIVQCHGGFRSASCIKCRKGCSSAWYRDEIEAGRIPRCTRVNDEEGKECGGLCKANITFFGEGLPKEFSDRKKQDMTNADLLLVIGTSLKVAPVANLPGEVSPFCPRVLCNRDPALVLAKDLDSTLKDGETRSGFGFRFQLDDNYRDVFVQGDCDAAVEKFSKELGWFKELQNLEKAYRPPKNTQSLYGTQQKTNQWGDKTYLPDPIPTLPLEKDGKKRIMRDMWLEGDIEDSLLALAAELGWLKDLATYSKQMATASREKLTAALAQAAVGHTKSAKGGNKKKKKKKKSDKGASVDTEVVREMKATAKAVARLILSGKCHSIAFLTGAGCSVGAGIPDFRSPGGMYDTLKPELLTATPEQREAMASAPSHVVSWELFQHNQLPYLELRRPFILGTMEAEWRPTVAHFFMRACADKGLLRRVYTQNIDGLDQLAGIPDDKLVNVHGAMSRVSCELCEKSVEPSWFAEQVRTNIRDITGQDTKAPSISTPIPCPHCGKPGIKPSTVLYGRDLPAQFEKCKKNDFAANIVDLFFVMGSSLTVQPACLLPNEAGTSCHRVLVNRDGAGNLDLFGRQRHRVTVESTTAPTMNSMQEAVNTAMKSQLTSMLDKFTEWQKELQQSEALIARTHATIAEAKKTANDAKVVVQARR